MLLSTAKMLEHMNLTHHAKQVKSAVEKVLKSGKVKTRDLGGYATTRTQVSGGVHTLESTEGRGVAVYVYNHMQRYVGGYGYSSRPL